MALDRDLGVAFVRAVREAGRGPGDGWEVTASTGVRGLRLVHEARGFRSFLFTETNRTTFEVLARNVAEVPAASARLADGAELPPPGSFDYVDVDPYGSPLRFLRAALAAVRTEGILAVSATDLPVLAGAQPEAARRRYGAEPVHGRLGPEGALRILLMVLAREARSGARTVRPLLAYVGGHHVRAYVRLVDPPVGPDPVGTIASDSWDGPPLGARGPAGPLWTGPIVDPEIASRLAVPPTAAHPRDLAVLLERLREDAAIVRPFYYEPNVLASRLALARPPPVDALVEELGARGYRAGRTHVRPEGVRTDAPRSAVEDAARALVPTG